MLERIHVMKKMRKLPMALLTVVATLCMAAPQFGPKSPQQAH